MKVWSQMTTWLRERTRFIPDMKVNFDLMSWMTWVMWSSMSQNVLVLSPCLLDITPSLRKLTITLPKSFRTLDQRSLSSLYCTSFIRSITWSFDSRLSMDRFSIRVFTQCDQEQPKRWSDLVLGRPEKLWPILARLPISYCSKIWQSGSTQCVNEIGKVSDL